MKGRLWWLWTVGTSAAALLAAVLLLFPKGEPLTGAVYPPPSPTAVPPVSERERVDVNRADLELLMTLPGVGETRARAIIQYRGEHGPFRYPEELISVPGIGEGLLEELLPLITAGTGGG